MKAVVYKMIHVLFAFVGIFALTILFLFCQSEGDITKSLSFFGYKPLTILSNSMLPTFGAGDLILINTTKKTELGDVITFVNDENKLITHRIIEIVEREGETLLKTKGDFNSQPDQGYITGDHVIGVKTHIMPNLGYITNFAARPLGIFLLIVLPIVIVAILEIFQRLHLIPEKVE